MSRKRTRILIISISVWDSLSTWLLDSKQAERKAICSSQTLQPQGSPSEVQALDLMKVIQIQDVTDKTYQRFSMKLLFIIMYQMNCIAKSSSFSFFVFPLLFTLSSCPPLFYCSSSSLLFFLCYFNLLKVFYLSPQSQSRSTSVSFCPQTLYLHSETT